MTILFDYIICIKIILTFLLSPFHLQNRQIDLKSRYICDIILILGIGQNRGIGDMMHPMSHMYTLCGICGTNVTFVKLIVTFDFCFVTNPTHKAQISKQISHILPQMSHIVPQMSHIMSKMSHIVQQMSNIVQQMSYIVPQMSPIVQ